MGMRLAGVASANPLGATIIATSAVATSLMVSSTARREAEICREYAAKNCLPNKKQTAKIAGMFGLTMGALGLAGVIGFFPAAGGLLGGGEVYRFFHEGETEWKESTVESLQMVNI